MNILQMCDVCGDSLKRNYVSNRLKLKRGRFTAEIMVIRDSTCNSGEICLKCLRDVLSRGKESKT